MSRLTWDDISERLYETGVKNGVLYPTDNTGAYSNGVAWNGLTGVTENPSGAEATDLYANDSKYLSLLSTETFGATIEAYTYPPEFEACDGSASLVTGVTIGQQARKTFGMCYRTTLGNDSEGNDYGYKLHIIYGAKASPSEKAYATINDSPEAITFSWEVTTTPVNVTGKKPTASLVIDSTKVDSSKLAAIEDILYGTAGTAARLPLPDEILSLMSTGATAYYPVNTYFTNVTGANVNKTAASNATYTSKLTAKTGHTIANVVVLVNGVDATTTAYTSNTTTVAVANPAGPITIFATANVNG